MAMTKTKTISRISIIYGGETPTMEIMSEVRFDDPDDAELPVVNSKMEAVMKTSYVQTDPDDPDSWQTVPTDLSGYDQKVQDIATLIWAD